jgi:hypothetical protein
MDKIDYYCHDNILNILELKDQISYLSTCHIVYYNLSIEKLSIHKQNQNFITNYIFRNVILLDVSNNNKITNVSFMKKLKILYADGTCGIDQNDIKGLDLIKLNANNNNKIKNVSFMKNLKNLHASFDCGIDQHGINGLNLFKLTASDNNNITNVSFMKKLKKLDARWDCGIDQNG